MTTTHAPGPLPVPTVIESKLRRVRRRHRFAHALAGVLATAAALLAAMMFAMIVDWVLILFNPAWCVAVTGTALVVTAVVFVLTFVRPLMRRLRLEAVALTVDQAVPALEERWSTVAEMAACNDPPSMRGADSLARKVTDEAVGMSDQVQVAEIAPLKGAKTPAVALAGALLVLALASTIASQQTSILLRRFWAPTIPISMTAIHTPTGDLVIPRRDPVVLEANITGRKHRTASLVIRDDSGRVHDLELTMLDEPRDTFRHRIRSVQTTFECRFRCGDGQSPWRRVTAVDRPNLAQVRFTITPPKYSKLEIDHRTSLPRKARALQGSTLELQFLPNKTLDTLELVLGDDQKLALDADSDSWYRYRKTLTETCSFKVCLCDDYGLTNPSPPACHLTVYPDRPPTANIVSPDTVMAVRPDATVKVRFTAADDLGVARAELVVAKAVGFETEELAVIPIPLEDQSGAAYVDVTTELDLTQFDLRHGDALTYAVRVTDTRNAASQSDWVGPGKPGQPGESGEEQAGEGAEGQAGEGAEGQAGEGAEGKPGDEAGGGTPPPNDMPKRQLNIPGQTASSTQHRLEIDEWAGTFEGQIRKKLQLAIDKYLADLDASLAAAQKLTGKLLGHARLARKWQEAQTGQLASASKHLVDADKTIEQLEQKSAGTPYAFMGLQLSDIGLSHVMPAQDHLTAAGTVTSRTDRLEPELDQAKYHIDRAREKLADLTRQYEDIKRQERIAEAMDKIAKMHQMFVEDMHAFLKASKPTLNPRDPNYAELSDEQMADLIERLQERFEKIKELMAALAEALADDPELMRRFMAAMRLDADTIRDQLTILAGRQKELHEQVVLWYVHNGLDRGALKDSFARDLIRQQIEIADAIWRMHDDVVTWMPRAQGQQDPALDKCRNVANEVARHARGVAPNLAAGATGQAVQLNRRLIDKLVELDQCLSEALDADSNNGKLVVYVASRKAQTVDLIMRLSGWAAKVQWLDQDQYGKFIQVDQYRLMTDTVAFGVKVDRVAAMVSRLSEAIADKAAELNRAVNADVVDCQVAADAALGSEQTEDSLRRQAETTKAFANAEKLFDELLTLIEEELAKRPPGIDLPRLPTLEELLAMLEQEAEACEKLGLAARLINLMIQGDWMMPGSGAGAGAGAGTGTGNAPGQGQAASSWSEMVRQLAEARAHAARAHARQAAAQMRKIGDAAVTTPELPESVGSQRDWATLVSELQKDFRQTRGNIPPEQYRNAIDRYFETISGKPTAPTGAR